MALALPIPVAPPPGSARVNRAYERWMEGCARSRQGLWADAASQFERAFEMEPDAAYGLAAAHALICAGRADHAIRRTARLRERQPAPLLAYTLESHALLERGRPEEAAACLLALPPALADERDHPYWLSLGVALSRCGRHDEAISAYMKALALKMDDATLHYRLGIAFKDKGMKVEAAECVRTALLLGLGDSDLAARSQLAHYEREACRWRQAEAEMATLREALARVPDTAAIETGPFTHAVLGEDPMELLKVARLYARHVSNMVGGPMPRRAARAHGQRLRIAYLSADFHQHATSQLMAQMLENHDRSRYEVTLISGGPDDGSPMRRRIEAACERFVDLRGQPQRVMAQRIRELNVDILVDAKGATFDTLMRVTAHRPAPVQVSWLGFPGTSGADYVDYFIGDRVVTPLEHAARYSEKIAQLPHCYQPNDALRLRPAASRREDWGAPADRLLLCAFHQSYKISRPVFDTWCDLLHRLPDAVLWLLRWNTNVEATLTAEARARGIDPARLLFAPLLPVDQHLSRLAHADLYLDAWPCNAHTTAGEALWNGVPVVTLIGETFAQRVAASLLHNVGLPELVCDSVDGYRAEVQALAGDAPRRAALRAQLLGARDTAPLFDGARFARDIEALYDRMWERAVKGLPPEHLPAQ